MSLLEEDTFFSSFLIRLFVLLIKQPSSVKLYQQCPQVFFSLFLVIATFTWSLYLLYSLTSCTCIFITCNLPSIKMIYAKTIVYILIQLYLLLSAWEEDGFGETLKDGFWWIAYSLLYSRITYGYICVLYLSAGVTVVREDSWCSCRKLMQHSQRNPPRKNKCNTSQGAAI